MRIGIAYHSNKASAVGLWLRAASRSLALAMAGLCAISAQAGVKLHALFADHMVLQQELSVPVWGWADEGETVTVQFRGQQQTATTRDGKWMVWLDPLKAGGPFKLVVSGKNRIELRDVLVGEVWICSGQSNMEWSLSRSYQSKEDIAKSANKRIRLFTVPKLKAPAPTPDVQSVWQECRPETSTNFSAVGYYFGRALERARKVPIGLIHTSWGGSPAEVWMSEPALAADPEYQRDIVDVSAAAWEKYLTAKTAAEAQGKPAPRAPWRPSELYNGMIAPLLPYAIRGAIWYQGEANAGKAYQYRKLFADVILNWRCDWGQGDFTFLAVQLAPWDRNRKRTLEQITEKPVESDWAELREAQCIVSKVLPRVGVAVITDVGDKDDIHPSKKVPVGERLALAARSIAYGEKTAGLSPSYESVEFIGSLAILKFSNAGKGLVAQGGPLKGFAIAGADRQFHWADARIERNRVIVSNRLVARPTAVRYGWDDFPVVNLANKEGLPATPFRTDSFPMITGPKPQAGK